MDVALKVAVEKLFVEECLDTVVWAVVLVWELWLLSC